MINILTRTYNRPKFFKICHESIQNQGYTNWTHIIAYDDEDTLQYLNLYLPNISSISVPKQVKTDINTFPYNLYFNEMAAYIKDGYVLYLDDDDSLASSDSLEKISPYLDINTLIIWRVKFPTELYPRDNVFNAKRITSSGYPSNCFCFHHSWLSDVSWTGKKGGDSVFLHKISKIIPKKVWLNEVITQINQQTLISGCGKGNDMS